MAAIMGPHPEDVFRDDKVKKKHQAKMKRLRWLYKYRIPQLSVVLYFLALVLFALGSVYVIEVELPAREALKNQVQSEVEFISWLRRESNIETASNNCVAIETKSYYDCFFEIVSAKTSDMSLAPQTVESMISIGVGLIYKSHLEARERKEMDLPESVRVPAELRKEVGLNEEMQIVHWYVFCLQMLEDYRPEAVVNYLVKNQVKNSIEVIAQKKLVALNDRLSKLPSNIRIEEQYIQLRTALDRLRSEDLLLVSSSIGQ